MQGRGACGRQQKHWQHASEHHAETRQKLGFETAAGPDEYYCCGKHATIACTPRLIVQGYCQGNTDLLYQYKCQDSSTTTGNRVFSRLFGNVSRIGYRRGKGYRVNQNIWVKRAHKAPGKSKTALQRRAKGSGSPDVDWQKAVHPQEATTSTSTTRGDRYKLRKVVRRCSILLCLDKYRCTEGMFETRPLLPRSKTRKSFQSFRHPLASFNWETGRG
eukprot:3937059-Rhodomonas_salina.1